MRTRSALVLAGVFWLGMNVMLWRAEFGQPTLIAGDVPVELVLQKVLAAQDQSTLEIRQRSRRIGFCRWSTAIEVAPQSEPLTQAPEGLVKHIAGYKVELDGQATLAGLPDKLRFECNARFDTNYALTRLRFQLRLLSASVEVSADTADESLRVSLDDGAGNTLARSFKFAEVREPWALADQLLGPGTTGAAGLVGLLPMPASINPADANVRYRAQNDRLQLGQAAIRAYKLEVDLSGRHKAVVYVSRAGEILQVELPGELRLTNQQLVPM
ncbi:MAG: hypothetical protein N2379_10420 [Verrucomicrobiae bacterium]|nr:hypothetical protein [Verrucomicrobiae bacterium]